MLSTTLGWALVALAVAIALVPILYGLHLAVVDETIKRHRSAHVVAMAVDVENETSCPFCGEHLTSNDLVMHSDLPEVSIAS